MITEPTCLARPDVYEISNEISETPNLISQGNAIGRPIYRVNPWHPWAIRSGAVAFGAALAALTTGFLTPPMLGWAAATAIAMVLLFAFCLAGFELRERYPIFTDRI